MELFELLFVNVCWGIDHYIPTTIVFGKRDKVTNGFLSSQNGDQSVQAKCNSTMGRCSVLEGIHQKAKLCFGFFWGKAQMFKHGGLSLFIINSYGASTDFVSIQYQIVGVGLYFPWF